jgi:menaquinone-dependent protoporphyrinogen oxidase
VESLITGSHQVYNPTIILTFNIQQGGTETKDLTGFWKPVRSITTKSFLEKSVSNKILVAYASRTGSTAEIAQVIGKTLAESDVQVDVLPMKDVQDLTPYNAVVAGSAIRKSKWLPEATQFIQTHRAELAQKRFAEFTVCITLAMSNTEQYRSVVAKWIEPVRALVTPQSEGFFPGMLDFKKLPLNLDTLGLRAAVVFGIFPRDDRRDWNAVRVWAESIRPMLLQ